MKVWSLYREDTGELSTKTYSGPDSWKPAEHTGWAAIEGEYDARSQRVDVATKTVVDWRPDKPSDEHVWNDAARRWQLTVDAFNRAEARRVAMARIDELERRQARVLREHALGRAGAAERLAALDDAIATERAKLT